MAFAWPRAKLGRSEGRALTIRAPQQHLPDNAATCAGMVAFVVVAAAVPALAKPGLDELFLGYTPHYLGTAIGVAAGVLAARLTYRRVRASP